MKDPGYLPERAWRDADGYDLEQDSRWDLVDPGYFGTDPSLDDWSRPRRSFLKSPVVKEDFDPTLGLTPRGSSTPALPFAAPTSASSAAGSFGRRRTPSPF